MKNLVKVAAGGRSTSSFGTIR